MFKKIILTLLLFGLLIPSVSLDAAANPLFKKGVDEAIGEESNTYVNVKGVGQIVVNSDRTDVTVAGIPKVSFPQFIGTMVKTILAVLGIIFIILIIYAGALWSLSVGDAAKITKAKGMLIAGVLGIIIIIGSYTIVSFVITAIGTPTPAVAPATTPAPTETPLPLF